MSDLGVIGIAWAIVLPMVSSSLIAFALIVRYLALSPVQVVLPLARVLAAAVVMFGCVTLVRDQAS